MADGGSLIMHDDEKVTATIEAVDDAGNPTTLPAGVVPAWAISDPDGTVKMTPSSDGMSCDFEATGKLTPPAPAVPAAGTVTVGDPAAGGISGAFSIDIDASGAASIGVSFGPASHK